jgi:hypothetical protein
MHDHDPSAPVLSAAVDLLRDSDSVGQRSALRLLAEELRAARAALAGSRQPWPHTASDFVRENGSESR